MPSMLHKPLGRTDLSVSGIGVGAGIGSGGSYESLPDVIWAAMDAGINFIDTAPSYGLGQSEEAVGRAVRGVRQEIVLATKIEPKDATSKDVARSVDESLARLGTDYIDLLQLHWTDGTPALDDVLSAMGAEVEAGRVRAIGAANVSAAVLDRIAGSNQHLAAAQVEYNLDDRGAERDVLSTCVANSLGLIASAPLRQGVVSSSAPCRGVLQRLASMYGKTTAQIALRWLVSHASVVAIPNTTKVSRVKENADSMGFELKQEEIQEISAACIMEPQLIPIAAIRMPETGVVFKTVSDALDNAEGAVPSPAELAKEISAGEYLKPIRVTPLDTMSADYQLVQGHLRYWAWVIAFDGQRSIPALVDGPRDWS